jgi:predicted transcriptional regulator
MRGADMEHKEKSEILAVIELLEENGFYVIKAEKQPIDEVTYRYKDGSILLRVVPIPRS